MTSKDEERKVLSEIKEILSRLEPDGYVRTAFEGCFEIAEDNITNDFACSMKQRAESAEEKVKNLLAENSELRARVKTLNDTLDESKKLRDSYLDSWKASGARERDLAKALNECKRDMDGTMQQLAEKDAEIMRLKAKLYDFIAEKEGE